VEENSYSGNNHSEKSKKNFFFFNNIWLRNSRKINKNCPKMVLEVKWLENGLKMALKRLYPLKLVQSSFEPQKKL